MSISPTEAAKTLLLRHEEVYKDRHQSIPPYLEIFSAGLNLQQLRSRKIPVALGMLLKILRIRCGQFIDLHIDRMKVRPGLIGVVHSSVWFGEGRTGANPTFVQGMGISNHASIYMLTAGLKSRPITHISHQRPCKKKLRGGPQH